MEVIEEVKSKFDKNERRDCVYKSHFFAHFSVEHYRKALKLYKSIVIQSFKPLLLPAIKWRPFHFETISVKYVFALANFFKFMKCKVILSLNSRYIS